MQRHPRDLLQNESSSHVLAATREVGEDSHGVARGRVQHFPNTLLFHYHPATST